MNAAKSVPVMTLQTFEIIVKFTLLCYVTVIIKKIPQFVPLYSFIQTSCKITDTTSCEYVSINVQLRQLLGVPFQSGGGKAAKPKSTKVICIH